VKRKKQPAPKKRKVAAAKSVTVMSEAGDAPQTVSVI
jgi:hypothetical protein